MANRGRGRGILFQLQAIAEKLKVTEGEGGEPPAAEEVDLLPPIPFPIYLDEIEEYQEYHQVGSPTGAPQNFPASVLSGMNNDSQLGQEGHRDDGFPSVDAGTGEIRPPDVVEDDQLDPELDEQPQEDNAQGYDDGEANPVEDIDEWNDPPELRFGWENFVGSVDAAEGPSHGMSTHRNKLATPLNLQEFLRNNEGYFHVDEDHMKDKMTAKAKKSKKTDFNECSFKDITYEAMFDFDEEGGMLDSFEAMELKMKNVTPDGGVKKLIFKPGDPGGYPPVDTRVCIKYVSCVDGKDEPLEVRTKPFFFTLGHDEVILGLDLAVRSMEAGEVSKFLLRPDYAYGKFGAVYDVEANTKILMCVHLLHFVDPAVVMEDPDSNEDGFLNVRQRLRDALAYKIEGNKFYRMEDYDRARSCYKNAQWKLDEFLTPNDELDRQRDEILFTVYSNMAGACLKAEEYEKVIKYCDKALDLPSSVPGSRAKIYYRKALAEFEFGRFESCKRNCKLAQNLNNFDPDIGNLYEKVVTRVMEDEKISRALLQRMSKALNV